MLSIHNEIIKKLYFYMIAAIAKKNAPHKEIENKIRFLYICGYFEKKLFLSIGKRGACAQARELQRKFFILLI